MTTVSFELSKDISFDLQKASPLTTHFSFGLGWSANDKGGADFDLDALALTLYSNKKIKSANDVIFYGNTALKKGDGTIVSPDGAVVHTGDDLTGGTDGDDETINVDTLKLSPDIKYVLFAVTIYDAEKRLQTFGQVENSYINIYDKDTGTQICHYNLKNDFIYDTGLVFGILEKQDSGTWNFTAVGSGFQGTLNDLLKKFS